MTEDHTCLSWWFPKLHDAGLPVPKTLIRMMSDSAKEAFWQWLDGKEPEDDCGRQFIVEIRNAADSIGYPCFLRTGMTSNKHYWKETCYLSSPDNVARQIMSLIEFSECADFMGLPWNVWAIRELLPTVPQMTTFHGRMPICREFRVFVEDGEVLCHHPYWPKDALLDGSPEVLGEGTFDWRYECLCYLPANDSEEVLRLAASAGKVLGGRWSVDILETKRGWYITDCAEMERSWHWPGCAKGSRRTDEGQARWRRSPPSRRPPLACT